MVAVAVAVAVAAAQQLLHPRHVLVERLVHGVQERTEGQPVGEGFAAGTLLGEVLRRHTHDPAQAPRPHRLKHRADARRVGADRLTTRVDPDGEDDRLRTVESRSDLGQVGDVTCDYAQPRCLNPEPFGTAGDGGDPVALE